MTNAPAALSLRVLLGIPADAGCLLGLEQVRQIARLIIRNRPSDPQACVVAEEALEDLGRDANRRNAGHDAPFLVIAGRQGAIALLTDPEAEGFRCVVLTAPEQVDRAAIAAAQLSAIQFGMPDLAMPEAQRSFVATVIAALMAEPDLRQVDLDTLLPTERHWISLARTIGQSTNASTLFALPELRQLLEKCGVERILLSTVNSEEYQLHTVGAFGSDAPQRIAFQPDLLIGATENARNNQAGIESMLDAAGRRWLGASTLTVVPLLWQGVTWGMLLAASSRPLAGAKRAELYGLGALIAATYGRIISAEHATLARMGAPQLHPATIISTPVALGRSGRPHAGHQASLAGDLGTLFEHLTDRIVLVDAQGRLAAYTAAAATTLGLRPADQGRPLLESGAACLGPVLSEALMGNGPVQGVIELANGAQATVHASSLEGSLWSFVIQEQTSSVFQPGVSAPADVHNENERFLYDFVHVIEEPLRELHALITSTSTAHESPRQQARLIGQIARLNSELTLLVGDLLVLGQIHLQTNADLGPLRLDLLIEAVISARYAELGRRGQHITVDLPPGLPRVLGSEEGLSRAIDALIDNAMKYCSAGSSIRVTAHHEAGNILVTVEDNGYGIRDNEIIHVFRPFYRADSAERAGVSGRGLGLTIARAIIEQHGGEIWAASHPDNGSVFTLRLPCPIAGTHRSGMA